MIKRKLFLLAVTIPYIAVVLILIPIASCVEGMSQAYRTAADSIVAAVDALIAAYKEVWRKPKEPEKNMWDDEDTWGAQ